MKKVALVFPGQGAQSVGMGQEFYQESAEARSIIDQADQVISGLKDVMFDGPQEKLTSTAFCQPAIFTHSVAALKALQASDVYQDFSVEYVCGLSLGEYSALAASNALPFEDVLNLIQKRSAHMQEATQLQKGAMAAVIGFAESDLVQICKETGAEVANFNSPAQIVITGAAEKVATAVGKIKQAGAKRVVPLDVAGAFHSSLMAPAAEKFKEDLKNISFQNADIPIISNVDAKPATDSEMIHSNLSTQITSSVQWVKTIEYAVSQGVETFIEIGPGAVLKGLIRQINRDLTTINIQKPSDIDAFNSRL